MTFNNDSYISPSPDAPTNGEVEPQVSNISFAEEVRTERLNIIWKSTLVIITIMAWMMITLGGTTGSGLGTEVTILPWLVVIAGCLGCSFALRRERLGIATWVYALGLLLAVATLLYAADSGSTTRELAPIFTIVIVFVVGLMLPAEAMLNFLPLNTFVIFAMPWFADGRISAVPTETWLTLGLSLVTAFISVQASGELFSIAEWALDNYRRERSTANQLYENREQIQRSLNRQRALADELSNANEELNVARRAAEEAKHFRGQFLANMSHELRTPLNAIIGFSETMLNFPLMYNNVELPQEYHQDLDQIHTSGKHLLNIINDILDLSKIDAGRLDLDFQEVDLEPIIKGSMSTAVGLVGGNPVKLTRETPDVIPMVKGDPVRLRQILLNIYSNAAKFTDKGFIKLILTHDDEMVKIGVQDTGIGIPLEDQQKIFEEFRQGDAGRKKGRDGAGLGMTISQQLLDMMGGDIWVESKVGKGSTFYFTVPIYKESTPEEIAENAPTTPVTTASNT